VKWSESRNGGQKKNNANINRQAVIEKEGSTHAVKKSRKVEVTHAKEEEHGMLRIVVETKKPHRRLRSSG
jgi:hypothetical protein